MLHVTCCAAPRDTFGRLLSMLEPADGLLMAITLGPGETSPPLPMGVGLLTLSALADGWAVITPQTSEVAEPRRYLAAGVSRSFEAHPALRVTWTPREAATPTPTRTRRRAATS
jgi:hypothetical protein